MEQKQPLPNAAAVLTLGICSIVFSCAGVGLILGIIGLVLSSRGRKLYKENPVIYDGYGTLIGGFVTSIIGTCISGFWVLYYIFIAAILGGTAFSMTHFVNQ